MGLKRTGEQVNLETDIIGRYVERLLSQESLQPPSGLSINTLAENGFI